MLTCWRLQCQLVFVLCFFCASDCPSVKKSVPNVGSGWQSGQGHPGRWVGREAIQLLGRKGLRLQSPAALLTVCCSYHFPHCSEKGRGRRLIYSCTFIYLSFIHAILSMYIIYIINHMHSHTPSSEKAQEYKLLQNCENGGGGGAVSSPPPSGLPVEWQKALIMPS